MAIYEDEDRSFGPFVLEIRPRAQSIDDRLRLYKAHHDALELQQVEPRALEVLAFITSLSSGTLISRKDILDHVWGKDKGDPNTLHQYVSKLRAALGDEYIQTIRRHGLKFVVPLRSSLGETHERSEDLPTDSDPINIYRRKVLHRYQLTLGEYGNPIWQYTTLDFSASNSSNELTTDAPILLATGGDAGEQTYRWKLEVRGEHLVIQTQHEHFPSDTGLEMYPFASRRKVLYGARINETWRKSSGPKIADSIVILSKGEPLEECKEIVNPGPIPDHLGSILNEKWLQGARHDIVRLPELVEGSGEGEQEFPNFLSTDIEKRLRHCKSFRLSLSWFPQLGASLKLFDALPRTAQLEFIISHPDCIFASYRGLAVHHNPGNVKSGAVQINSMRNTLRDLKHTHPNLTVKVTDWPIPNAYVQIDEVVYYSILWANGNAVEGPWRRTNVKSIFGRALESQFAWLWGRSEGEYEWLDGNPPSQEDQLEDNAPAMVNHLSSNQKLPSPIRQGINSEPRLRQFWHRYLADEPLPDNPRELRRKLVIYGKPLFWRNVERSEFGRTVGVDMEAEYPKNGDKIACHTFVNTGEVECMLKLLKWFSEKGVTLEDRGRRKEDSTETMYVPSDRTAHGIVLGTPGDNGMIDDHQQDLEFVFEVDDEGVRDKRQKDTAGKSTLRFKNQYFKTRAHAFVVVSRTNGGRDVDSVVTAIYSRVGRAITGLGELLTSEARMAELCAQVGVVDQWPEKFQLVFEVTLNYRDGIISNAFKPVDVWLGPA